MMDKTLTDPKNVMEVMTTIWSKKWKFPLPKFLQLTFDGSILKTKYSKKIGLTRQVYNGPRVVKFISAKNSKNFGQK